jgi:hypothetical protein
MIGYFSALGQADMIVHPGTDVTLGPGVTLDIGGEKLLLQDDLSSTPSFLQYGNLNFSNGGKTYVEQYLPKDGWHMICSPVSDEVIEAFLWNYLLEFDEPTGAFNDLTLPVTIPINVGQGYFAWSYTASPTWPISPDSVVMDGTLNNANVNLVLSNTDASPQSGWNLVGNPFPVAIEWNGDSDWNLNNVAGTMYILDADGSGNYLTWNPISGGTNPNGGYIAATQGFWVRTADTTGTAASITIPVSQRVHNNAVFYKSGESFLPNQLMLTVEGADQADKTIVGFIEEATQDYDAKYDGVYYYPPAEAISLYTTTNQQKFALNHLPSVKTNTTIPLAFESKVEALYSISAEWMNSFSEDLPIFLQDKRDGVYINLREQYIYHFSSSPFDDPNRFNLLFTNPYIDANPMEYVHVYSYDKSVYVNIPFEVSGNIFVYDITGRILHSSQAYEGQNHFELNRAKGNYIVKVVADKGTISKKVYIK